MEEKKSVTKRFIKIKPEYFFKKFDEFDLMSDRERQSIIHQELTRISFEINSADNKTVFISDDLEIIELELKEDETIDLIYENKHEFETVKKSALQDIDPAFFLTTQQNNKLRKWKKSLPKLQLGAIDFGYTYCFTPNGFGETVKVKRDDGHEIDLTDYESF